MGCIESWCIDADTVETHIQVRPIKKHSIPVPQQSPRSKPVEPQPTKMPSKVKQNDRVPTQASRSKDIVIRIDQIDAKIVQAQNAVSGGDEAYAVQIFDKIVKTIYESSDRSMKMMQKMAYSYAQRATLTTDQNGGSQTFYKCSTQALKIYQLDQVNYFEQIIALLNNMALRDEQEKRYHQAIKKYEEIFNIQSRYMSVYDERTLITQNNLACLYFESKQNDKGKALFQKLLKHVKTQSISDEVKTLIEKNYGYYKRY